MKLFSFAGILAIVLFTGCSLLGGGGPKTLTGSITGSTTNVVVGAFSNAYRFYDGLAGDEDEVASESAGGSSFTPIAKATITGTTYSIDLPEDVATMGYLIAWVDNNQNGVYDLGNGEAGYFPMKSINGMDYVVSIGSIFGNYSYSYYDGTSNYIISIDDTNDAAGFNFTVD